MITKRQLGFGFMIVALLVSFGSFAIDWWRTSNLEMFDSQIGPVQVAALAASALLFLVGLSLIPLGSRPA